MAIVLDDNAGQDFFFRHYGLHVPDAVFSIANAVEDGEIDATEGYARMKGKTPLHVAQDLIADAVAVAERRNAARYAEAGAERRRAAAEAGNRAARGAAKAHASGAAAAEDAILRRQERA